MAGLHSFLIVRDGMLVVEEYFDGWRADELHMQQSVSKSFTSALVGIAIERNDFKGVDETVLGFYPADMDIKYLDDRMHILNFYCVKNEATKDDETEDFIRYSELRDDLVITKT